MGAQNLQGVSGGIARVRTQGFSTACCFPRLMPCRNGQELQGDVPDQHAWPLGFSPCSLILLLRWRMWSSSVAVSRFVLLLRGSAKRRRRWRSA